MSGRTKGWGASSARSVHAPAASGVGTNNGVSAVSSSDGIHRDAGSWPASSVWYEVKIVIDTAADVAWVELYAGPVLIGSSAANPAPITAGATTISQIGFEGTAWGLPQNTCWFDYLTYAT